MEKAEYVISRSGYSTVMDIAALGKIYSVSYTGTNRAGIPSKIPDEKKFAVCIGQDEFSLHRRVWRKPRQFEYKIE